MPFIQTRVHGTSVVPEIMGGTHLEQVGGRPWTDIIGLAQGWGRTFAGNTTESWFHFSIPSVTNLDGSVLYLDQFYVFFTSTLDSGRYAGVDQVDVWDGSARIWTHALPDVMAGDWSNPRSTPPDRFGIVISNTFLPRDAAGNRFQIFTAVGISLHVSFIVGGNICFHSAGANFVDSPS